MKLIDLYQMIANGDLEEGTEIKIDGDIYKYSRGALRDIKADEFAYGLLTELKESLNEEVEIIPKVAEKKQNRRVLQMK